MIDIKDIIHALRCSSSAGKAANEDCLKCPYGSLDEISEKYKGLADIKKDGKYYAIDCDCDRICKDAANALERLSEDGRHDDQV